MAASALIIVASQIISLIFSINTNDNPKSIIAPMAPTTANLINEELKYFFEGDGARVRIVKIQFSDDYNEKIENTVNKL